MKPFSKKLIKLFIVILIFFIITWIGLEVLFNFSNKLTTLIKDLTPNWISALTIVGILGIDILVPVPSSIVMVVTGHLFGGLLGGLLVIIGSLIASIAGFLVSRKLGQTKVIKWLGEKDYFQASILMEKHGSYALLLTRSVPLVMESMSCVAGLSKMRLRKYILINIIGYLPLAFLYTFTGAVANNDNKIGVILVLILGFFVPVTIWFLFIKTIRKNKNNNL